MRARTSRGNLHIRAVTALVPFLAPLGAQGSPELWNALREREKRAGTVPEEGARWFGPEEEKRAVALVVHGLNLKPSKMDTLSRFLAQKGVASLRMTLAGHGGAPAAMKSVSRDEWLGDLVAAYRIVRSEAKGVPVHLVAFSLGALVALDAENDPRHDVRFDREVLFAPAVGARLFTQFVRLLDPFPSIVIPSASPSEYRANGGTAVAAYSALFDSIDALRKNGFRRSVGPGLVFLDPRDELVSPSALETIQAENPTLRWRTETLTVEPEPGLWPRYHHLVIDPRATGARNWERITRAIEEHLR